MTNLTRHSKYTFFGAVALLLASGISNQAYAEECAVWASTRNAAITKLQDQCNVTFNTSAGHYCEITPAGKHKCSDGGNTTTTTTTTPTGEECIANAPTLNGAISYFESKCNVTYSTAAGHSCTKKSTGGYRCETGVGTTTGEPKPPTDPLPPSGGSCAVKWNPTSSKLATSGWGAGGGYVGGNDRVSYNAANNAIAIKQDKREKQISQHKPSTWVSGNTARLSVQMYIPNEYVPDKDNRFAIGIRGGDTPNASCASGGGRCTRAQQDGWTVRINYGNTLKPNVYGYHLNRTPTNLHGEGPVASSALPKGQWLNMVLDVTLNDVGKTNGSATLTVTNSSGKVLSKTTQSNAVYRKNSSWNNFGIMLTDKNEKGAIVPASILYRDYKLFVGNGSSCQ